MLNVIKTKLFKNKGLKLIRLRVWTEVKDKLTPKAV